MINNRQGNRRRGRNNSPRQNNNRGGGDSGNRIDSRARGNATQLLEKYKNMARDAQTQGDRVMTEYYLQFADHYFRVLADVRARQEEQQAERRARHEERSQNWRDDNGDEGRGYENRGDYNRDNEGPEIEGVEHGVEGDMIADASPMREPRQNVDAGDEEDRPARAPRARREPRNESRREQSGDRPQRAERAERPERAERSERTERTSRPRRAAPAANGPANGRSNDEGESLGLDASLLPPSIAPTLDSDEAEAPRPRRGRRPKAETTPEGSAAD